MPRTRSRITTRFLARPSAPAALPFAEANLRVGYQTVTIPAGTTSYTPPTTSDYLIDLQWVERSRRLLILGRAGQRIKIINGYWNVTGTLPTGSAYGYGGIGFRTADATGAEHISLTGALITGPSLADGIVFDATDNTKVTIQRTRVESGSLITGAPTTWGLGSALEHLDALQVQGNIGSIEVGLATFYTCSVQSGNDPGKAFMLGGAWGPYPVNLAKVNFRDTAGLAGQGAFIFQDDLDCPITFSEVYGLVEKAAGGAYQWASGSSLFVAYNNGLLGYPWTSSGSAPNRTASFSAPGWTGTVLEGKSPDGDDYVTRADLGF